MKLKQISLILFSVTSIILTALFIQSCNSNDDYEQLSPISTKADELVASVEFQEYQATVDKFVRNYRKKYSKLSKSDQEQVNEILSKMVDTNTEDVKGLYEKVNSIIGVNLENEFNDIATKSASFQKNENMMNISQKDLATAVRK